MPASLPNPIIYKQTVGDDVAIHTFISAFTDNNIANATHIVESKNVIVIIDGQFLRTYATLFRAYVDSLNKPIERLYISHGHPDHWFGLASGFTDVQAHALPETIDWIKANATQEVLGHKALLGAEGPPGIVTPTIAVSPSVETIDGVTYVFDRVVDTEFDYILTTRLPQFGVCIPQDLIYSGTHLYLTKNFQNWIAVLQKLLKTNDAMFLGGHGFPAGKDEVAGNIEYLIAANEAYMNGLTDAAFKSFLLERYPHRLCPGIFDIYLPRLFDGAPQN